MKHGSGGPGASRKPGRARAGGLGSRQWRVLGRIALTLTLAVLLLVLVAGGLLVGAAVAISTRLPSVDALYNLPSEATRIYAANGELIASLYKENRDSVALDRVSPTLQRAVIDTEDADFYRHRGVSLKGILRAGLLDLQDRGYTEGGSTITQQLARNLFLTPQKSMSRKIAEILLAVQIERRLTKAEILQRYLNQVYFGQGAYGVETASEVYFGKPAASLSLPESALLAGLIRAPSYYSPYEHPGRAKQRMSEVLLRMVEQGDISAPQMRAAEQAPLHLAAKTNAGLIGIRAPYFVSYILPGLLERYGEDRLYKGGLRIYTTLDLATQVAAQTAIRQGIEQAKRGRLHVQEGALVAIDPKTGYIRAMVGGYDFRKSQFNRAWQAHRQPGSAFKPFTYTVAVMRGIPPTHILLDAPIEFPMPDGTVWRPTDFEKQWHGLVTARYALENSLNTATIRLEQEVGPQAVADLAHRMGVASKLEPELALTLGASDVTLLEMTSAYGVFANGGVRAAPIAVTRVTDWSGKVLEEHVPARHVVLSPEVAYVMTDMLKGVVLRGTGTAANLNIPQAGKTGTSDDYRNAWFIGFTPHIVAGVWFGNDDNSPMNHVVGGSLPAPVWAAFMKQILPSLPKDDWTPPDGVVQETVCATASCGDTRPEVFIHGTEPDAGAPPATPAAAGQPAPAGQPSPGAGTPGASGAPAPTPAVPAVVSPAPPAAPPAHAVLPLVITAPRDASEVTLPLAITGAAPAGSLIHLTVMSVAGALRVEAADVYIRADQNGTFGYQVQPWLRPSGGTLIITAAAAAGPDGVATSGTATVSVHIK
jgi:penicillin-binding protein 1A